LSLCGGGLFRGSGRSPLSGSTRGWTAPGASCDSLGSCRGGRWSSSLLSARLRGLLGGGRLGFGCLLGLGLGRFLGGRAFGRWHLLLMGRSSGRFRFLLEGLQFFLAVLRDLVGGSHLGEDVGRDAFLECASKVAANSSAGGEFVVGLNVFQDHRDARPRSILARSDGLEGHIFVPWMVLSSSLGWCAGHRRCC